MRACTSVWSCTSVAYHAILASIPLLSCDARMHNLNQAENRVKQILAHPPHSYAEISSEQTLTDCCVKALLSPHLFRILRGQSLDRQIYLKALCTCTVRHRELRRATGRLPHPRQRRPQRQQERIQRTEQKLLESLSMIQMA